MSSPMNTESVIKMAATIADKRHKLAVVIGNADAKQCDAYRALVAILDEHRAIVANPDTNRLHDGVLDYVIGDDKAVIDKTVLSSAWTAFNRNPEAYAKVTAVRNFSRVPEPGTEDDDKGKGKNQEPDAAAKALKAFTSALQRALKAHVDNNTLIVVFNASLPKPKAHKASKADAPADAPADEPAVEALAD